MKQRLALLLLSVLALSAWAGPVSRRAARAVAEDFLAARGVTMSSGAKAFAAPKADAATADTAATFYVFNAGADKGFVVVSGDDATCPVLGYSLSGTLAEDAMPDNMRCWLGEYDRQIKFLRSSGATAATSAAEASARAATDRARIAPMLTTKWNQTYPYNAACPMVGLTYESVTGCVATAMAQVIYQQYLRHPEKMVTATTAEIPAYTCKTKWNGYETNVAAVPEGSQIDWENMPQSYDGTDTEAQKKAVADLMLYCGAAVRMNYGPSSNGGSGAVMFNIPWALRKYFGFDASVMTISRDDGYYTEQWNDIVYEELAAGRTVCYSGQASSSGHAFVIEGYDANNFFYVNWGWGGTGDGAFLLSVLNPNDTGVGAGSASGSDGYAYSQQMIVGAEPDHGGKVASAAVMRDYKWSDNTRSFCLGNAALETVSYDYAFGSVADDGTLSPLSTVVTANNMPIQTYYSSMARIDLGTLPPGNYTVVPMARQAGVGADWSSLWYKRVLRVTVGDDGSVVASDAAEPDMLSSVAVTSFSVDGDVVTGRSAKVSATLESDGSCAFEGRLYLFASQTGEKGKALATTQAGMYAGGTAEVSMMWHPSVSGTYTLWLCADASGKTVLATLGDVEVTGEDVSGLFYLESMAVKGEDESSRAVDADGRVVTGVSGNGIVGKAVIVSTDSVAAGTNFAVFINRYDEATGKYVDYNAKALPGGMPVVSLTKAVAAGYSLTLEFSFPDLPDGKYVIRPEVGKLKATSYYYMSPELWFDDSRAYVLGAATGVTAATVADPSRMVAVYNLQGQKVGVMPADGVRRLPSGIYVVDGKKVAVR